MPKKPPSPRVKWTIRPRWHGKRSGQMPIASSRRARDPTPGRAGSTRARSGGAGLGCGGVRWWMSESQNWGCRPRVPSGCRDRANLTNRRSPYGLSRPLANLSQGRPFVDRDVIGLVALDEILRLSPRCVPAVTLEDDCRSDLADDDTGDPAGFRVPRDEVPDAQIRHGFALLMF